MAKVKVPCPFLKPQFKSPKIIGPAKPPSSLQRWARRRNWQYRVLFGNRGLVHELEFRLEMRWKESIHKKDTFRTQTCTDEEIQIMQEIIERFKLLDKGWKNNHKKIRDKIDFKKFI